MPPSKLMLFIKPALSFALGWDIHIHTYTYLSAAFFIQR